MLFCPAMDGMDEKSENRARVRALDETIERLKAERAAKASETAKLSRRIEILQRRRNRLLHMGES